MDDGEQQLFDIAVEREQRRDRQGYVSPTQARAFLQLARERGDASAERNPIVVACLGRVGGKPGLVRAHDGAQAGRALEEVAFAANVLIAGCPIQRRAFTPDEASRAAAAICTLGASHASGTDRDLVRAFEIGWRILYRDVCLYAARQLLAVLRELRVADYDIQSGLDALQFELETATREGEPWRARASVEVIMMLDMPAWAAWLGLIAECPVIHVAMHARGVRAVSAAAFEFISDHEQLATVREFLDVRLRDMLYPRAGTSRG